MGAFIEIPSFDIWRDERWARRENWWLEERLIYHSCEYHQTIIVPAGFETDLASIPRMARLLAPKNDSHRAPAVVHDWLCRTATSHAERKRADRIFLEAMQDVDDCRECFWAVGLWRGFRRRAMYGAVRLQGMLKRFP